MTKLDQIVVRALINGDVVFDDSLPNRFAKIGKARLYRPVVGSGRWAFLFCHIERDYGIDLGWIAHNAMLIAARYRT